MPKFYHRLVYCAYGMLLLASHAAADEILKVLAMSYLVNLT